MKRDAESRASVGPSRREFVALGIGAFVVAVLPPVVGRRRRPRLVRRTVPLMGTIAELAVVHRDARYAYAAIDAAIRELRLVDRTMSRFRADSDVGRANRAALRQPVVVTPETAHVLERALRWAEASSGEFDPCLGKAVTLWDVAHRRTPPPPDRVRALAGRELYRALELGVWRRRPVVLFHDPDVALDLGGIAKGYGVDRAMEALRAYGIASGLVNVGGDLYALGRSEDGDPWRVGIRDPDRPERLADTFDVEDCAVATSGDYLQYFRYRGRRYHHMLDPRTGEPKRTGMRSVTVVAATCLDADAAATAVFGLPGPQAEPVLRAAAPDARVVRRL